MPFSDALNLSGRFFGLGWQLNNKFPTDPSAPVAILDMAGMDDITLATCGQADKDSKAWEKFPLVIRLEAVYDKAKNDGHKLTVRHAFQALFLCTWSVLSEIRVDFRFDSTFPGCMGVVQLCSVAACSLCMQTCKPDLRSLSNNPCLCEP